MNIILEFTRILEFLNRIGSSYLYRKFFSDLVSKFGAVNSPLSEITHVPSYGSAERLEDNHSKVHLEF